MWFRWRKPRSPSGGASQPTDPSDETAQGESPGWETWRRSAQKVRRTWSEWLAADGRARCELYQRYTCALGEEEHAAARLERMVDSGAEIQDRGERTADIACNDGTRATRR
jgi:hypothetical protein